VIFPYYYDEVSRWGQDPLTGETRAFGPTTAGKLLLIVRNALVVIFGLHVLRTSARALRRPEAP
jgi:hypothetical protein